MNFLPGLNTNVKSIEIPFLVDTDGPIEPVTEYSALTDVPEEELAPAIQSALFFGLLAALQDDQIALDSVRKRYTDSETRLRDFVANDGVEKIVSKICLNLTANDSRPRSHRQQGLRADGFLRCRNILYQAHEKLFTIESALRDESGTALSMVIASVHVLVSFMRAAIGEPSNRQEWPHCRSDPSTTGMVLRDFMLAQGWCPHQVRKLLRVFPAHVVNCFALLARSTHHVTHVRCRLDRCHGWTLSDSATSAMPKHVEPGCECSILTVSSTDVARIIRRGGIPLISIQETSSGGIDLSVCQRSR